MYSTATITSSDGDTEAQFVPEANMLCARLHHRGDELLDPGRGVDAYAQQGKTMGIPLLHPWANRLSHAGFSAAGTTVSLPSPDGRYGRDPSGLPIHGALPGLLRWDVEPGSPPDRLTARLEWNSPALMELFPFEHELTMAVRVDLAELTVETTLRATGERPVPVSFGFHPYLRLPGSPRAGWRVALGAAQRLVLDEQMIPTGDREPLSEREFVLGEQSWDDSLCGLNDPPRFVVSDDRLAVRMTFEAGFRFAQVYAPPGHDYICFEPMTAPTDALNSGDGLTVVAPGDEYRTRFRLSVTP